MVVAAVKCTGGRVYKACGPATVATCMAGELRVQQARKVKAFATSLNPLC